MEGMQLELPAVPTAPVQIPKLPRHKRLHPAVHLMMGVGGDDFPPRDDGVDLTVLYNHNGTEFCLASDEAILASADRLLTRRLRRGTPILHYPKLLKRFLQAKLACQKRAVFFAFFLDRHSRLIQVAELFNGTVNSVTVSPREVLRAAYACDAEAVFCARTDPGGDSGPSQDDIINARRLNDAFKLAEIPFYDYFIAGKSLVSLARRGCLLTPAERMSRQSRQRASVSPKVDFTTPEL